MDVTVLGWAVTLGADDSGLDGPPAPDQAATSGLGTGRHLGRVPAEVTSFVGRRSEVAEAQGLLAVARLVTLTGVGGAGKTRLALRVARLSRRAFPDGVWVVELAPLPSGSLIDFAVAEALEIRDQTVRPVREVLIEYLRQRQLLLVLDNCEHLLDSCAEFAASTLLAAPDLRIMCTSRQPLGIVGEHPREVPPMPVPDQTRRTARPAERCDVMGLFAERAAAAAPGFRLHCDNADHVVEICRRVDGLPLGIELAAAQLRTLSIEQLAAALRTPSRPGRVRHATPADHRSLAATFDWSYALCAPTEQALWRRMSVFVGSFELAAIEYVSGAGPGTESILAAVAGLVDKSVLRRTDADGDARYQLLDTVRQYGLDRLPAGDREVGAFRRRHRDWYLRVAQRFSAAWFGPDQPRWAQLMRREQPNLRAALEFSLTTPGERETGAGMAADLLYAWYGSGLLHEGRYWLFRALAASPRPTVTRMRALAAYSRITLTMGDLATAESAAREYLDLARLLDQPAFVDYATADLGTIALVGNDLARARTLLEEALARFAERTEFGVDVAVARTALAMTLFYQGEPEQAAAVLAACRADCAARGERHWRAFASVAAVLISRAQGDHAAAAEHLRESVRLRQPLGDALGLAGSIERLAWIAADGGEHQRAAVLLGAANRLWKMIGRTLYGAPEWLRGREECEPVVRAQLGEATYQRALSRGARLTTDEAIAYALREDRSPRAKAPTATSLTPREQQIARLVGEGLSNRQIAAQLVISQRTAESHVENLLRKLGFASRTQIAAWISRTEA